MSFYFTFIIISLFFFKLACKAYDTNKIVFSICYAFAILIPAILGGYRDLSVGIDVLVYGESMFDYAKSCSSISELIDDASTREYGYFLLNGYKYYCYLTKSTKTNYNIRKRYLELSIEIATDKPYWIKETIKEINFAKEETSNALKLSDG